MGSNISACVSCIERDNEEQQSKSWIERLQEAEEKAAGEPTAKYIFGVVCNQRFNLDQEFYQGTQGGNEEFFYERVDAQTSKITGTNTVLTFAADGADIVGQTFNTRTASGRDVTWRVASVRSGDPKYLTIEILQSQVSETGEQSKAACTSENELKAHIKAIVNAGADRCKLSTSRADPELQSKINAIVNARRQPSHAAWSPGAELQPHIEEPCQQSPVACSDVNGLQEQINAIVGVHSKSLTQQRLSLDLPSPSPAKSVSDLEFEYFANLALSRAKERNTPATSPPPSLQPLHWSTYEHEVAPCKLSFADCGDSLEAQEEPSTIPAEIDSQFPSLTRPWEKSIDIPKVQTCPFNVNEIPSPTRNRAKKQLWAEVDAQEMAEEEAQEEEAGDVDQQKSAEEEASKLKEMQAMWLRKFEEQAEMAAMDKICVETFLESVKTCASRSRVRTPIKGSNLYTKVIRPSRPAGTSVDVKDSSFRNLGIFLQFLEAEGLLWLQPGLSDPVVTQINFDTCRKYKYNPQQGEQFLAATREAPHEAGCSCRLCTPCVASSPSSQWQ